MNIIKKIYFIDTYAYIYYVSCCTGDVKIHYIKTNLNHRVSTHTKKAN